MLNLLYFVITVLAFIAYFCGLIIRSLLIASLELLSTMLIVAYLNYLQGVVPAQCMHAVNHIDSFENLVRKRVVGFTERLKISKNSIISCIDNSWKMKFEIWIKSWIKLLYKK